MNHDSAAEQKNVSQFIPVLIGLIFQLVLIGASMFPGNCWTQMRSSEASFQHKRYRLCERHSVLSGTHDLGRGFQQTQVQQTICVHRYKLTVNCYYAQTKLNHCWSETFKKFHWCFILKQDAVCYVKYPLSSFAGEMQKTNDCVEMFECFKVKHRCKLASMRGFCSFKCKDMVMCCWMMQWLTIRG